MKRLLILLSILICLAIGGSVSAISLIGSGIESAGCDDCSGDLKFAWHAENVDVTLGTPCGCSDGDTTATATNSPEISATQKQDGTYAIKADASGEYYTITSTNDDVINDAEGKITGYLYVDTFENVKIFMRFYAEAGDYIDFQIAGVDANDIDITVTYYGAATSQVVRAEYSGVEDSWIYFEYQWKTSETAADHYIKVCDSDGVSNCATAGPEDDLTSMEANIADLRFGMISTVTTAVVYLDNIKIYATSGL